MSRTYSAAKSEHQGQQRVSYRGYFYTPNEPRGYVSADMMDEVEAELLESVVPMRQEFRRLTRRMRIRNA